jgi:STE24 endopeptidase
MVDEREVSRRGHRDRDPAVVFADLPSLPPNAPSANSDRTEPLARRYHTRRRSLSLAQAILGVAFTLVVLSTGFSVTLEELARQISDNDYVVLIGFVLLFGLLESMVTFPLRVMSGYILEHRYRLSNQRIGQWMWERLKGSLVGALIGLPLVLGLYVSLRMLGHLWWIPVGILAFLISVLLARLAPTLIFPLFYKFSPVEDSVLRERLIALCRRVGIPIEGVYVFNMSKTTKKANAAFTGIGRAKRIILGDTLVANFSDEEIETVFAHELGHYELRHIRVMLLVGFLSTFLGLAATSVAFDASFPWFGFSERTTIAGLPLLGLWLAAYSLIMTPLTNILSRSHERAADRYAVNLTQHPETFVNALKKLAYVNLAELQPPRVIEFLFHSHPSLASRIRTIEGGGANR